MSICNFLMLLYLRHQNDLYYKYCSAFMSLIWSAVTISLFPVAVTTISALLLSSKQLHNLYFSGAHIGSASVTSTLAPLCLNGGTSFTYVPKPATIATLPDIITSVALLIPSTKLSLHP